MQTPKQEVDVLLQTGDGKSCRGPLRRRRPGQIPRSRARGIRVSRRTSSWVVVRSLLSLLLGQFSFLPPKPIPIPLGELLVYLPGGLISQRAPVLLPEIWCQVMEWNSLSLGSIQRQFLKTKVGTPSFRGRACKRWSGRWFLEACHPPRFLLLFWGRVDTVTFLSLYVL